MATGLATMVDIGDPPDQILNRNVNIISVPSNRTLESTGLCSIIIIKPDKPDLLHDPLEITRVMADSPFSHYLMKDIRTNKKKNLIVAELASPNPSAIKNLLLVEKLGNWKVTCYQPKQDSEICGVISPIAQNVDLMEIKSLLKIKDSSLSAETKVINVERLKKKIDNEWIDSTSLKITFTGNKIPEAVTIGYSLYRIRHFVGLPLQCYKCQRLGHTAIGCKSQVRCLLCGGPHSKNECEIKDITQYKCSNCKGPHRANSNDCAIYKMAKQIEKVRVTSSSTYLEARKSVQEQVVTSNTRSPPQTNYSPKNTAPIVAKSYREALDPLTSNTICTQTENQTLDKEESNIQTVDLIKQILEEEFLTKMKKCISQILEIFIPGINKNKENSETIDSIIAQNFTEKRGIIRKDRESSKSSSNSLDSAEDNDLITPCNCIDQTTCLHKQPSRCASQPSFQIKKNKKSKKNKSN